MNDKEKLISLLILADPNPYICESESGSCELTTCTECRARSTSDLLIENDFLPVVRCKDCVHAVEIEKDYARKLFVDGTKQCELGRSDKVFGYSIISNDGFCDSGERK